MKTKIISVLTLIAYLVMVSVNYLAVLLPLGGRSTGEISDNYFNLFAPAGYAFSIWGLIYTLLAIYVIYQFWQGKNELVGRVNKIFIINALLNASWIFAWHYDLIWLSVIIMIGLLVTLILIADTFKKRELTTKENWLVRLPFSIYFGWITVATIANVTILLVSLNWNGFGLADHIWTVVILLVGAGIGIARMLKDKNIVYGLVLVWAYLAILFKHISAQNFNSQYPSIIYTVIICLVLYVGVIGFLGYKKIKVK